MQRMAHDEGVRQLQCLLCVDDNKALTTTTLLPIHPQECGGVAAAAAVGTLHVLSSWATASIEEVAAAAPDGYRWFQVLPQTALLYILTQSPASDSPLLCAHSCTCTEIAS